MKNLKEEQHISWYKFSSTRLNLFDIKRVFHESWKKTRSENLLKLKDKPLPSLIVSV